MPKPPASDADVIQLTDEFTWMGGDPAAISLLLARKQFTRDAIESAIAAVMSRHSCVTTYASALSCKHVLERALNGLE